MLVLSGYIFILPQIYCTVMLRCGQMLHTKQRNTHLLTTGSHKGLTAAFTRARGDCCSNKW